MSKVQLAGNASGTGIFTIASPNSNVDRTLTLPDNTGTVLTTASSLAGLTGVGKILQVVQGSTTSNAQSNDNSTWVDTNLSASITPSSASSKIMVIGYHGSARVFTGATNGIQVRLMRGSTEITKVATELAYITIGVDVAVPFFWLDSPATTSSTTYKTQFKLLTANSSSAQMNSNNSPAVILLLEVAP